MTNQLEKRYDIDYVRLTSGIFMGEFIEANNVHEDVCYRKTLKPLTQILIPEVEFHRPPKKANKSDRLSIKKTRDTIIHLVEKKSSDDSKQMNVLFEDALLLR